MKKVLKQVAGIDVAQKELVVCLGRMFEDLTNELYAHETFANTASGFKSLVVWANKLGDPSLPFHFVMEATGVYHESFAYFLDKKGYSLSVVLPNKISNYCRTLEVKTVTDKTASQAIALFGLERNLDNWKRPKAIYKSLKQLCRERYQIVQERTMAKNQLHAETSEAEPNKSTVTRIKQRIAFLNKQEKAIKEDIAGIIESDSDLKAEVKLICSIMGIGTLTAAVVLGETNGFELIRNKRQLASYAGFDVKQKQSGTSVKGKPRISKHGNKYLRQSMHLPSLSAVKYDERFKAIYARGISKHDIKMKALVAVQRKLLEMTYTIYKTKKRYDKNYFQKVQSRKEEDKVAII